jgi:hypothetical protein
MDKVLDLADRHPILFGFLVVVGLLVVLAVVGFLIALVLEAQLPKMTEEEARAAPRRFAFRVLAKQWAPVLVGSGKAFLGFLFTAAANALVDRFFPGARPPSLEAPTTPRDATIPPEPPRS